MIDKLWKVNLARESSQEGEGGKFKQVQRIENMEQKPFVRKSITMFF